MQLSFGTQVKSIDTANIKEFMKSLSQFFFDKLTIQLSNNNLYFLNHLELDIDITIFT